MKLPEPSRFSFLVVLLLALAVSACSKASDALPVDASDQTVTNNLKVSVSDDLEKRSDDLVQDASEIPGDISNAASAIEELSPAQEMLNLAQYKGKVVYLDFWASWCVPCQQTFPWMDAMQKKYPDDIIFVAVNFGENPEDTQDFLKKFPADIKFVYDPLIQIASEYGIPGLPYSFIYGRNGELLGKHAGFSGGSEINLEAALQNLFASGE
jgi:thiol-disulfide isomerase/thioredoxin